MHLKHTYIVHVCDELYEHSSVLYQTGTLGIAYYALNEKTIATVA
jgi:hypothetical protein